jgi:hypothetical protein
MCPEVWEARVAVTGVMRGAVCGCSPLPYRLWLMGPQPEQLPAEAVLRVRRVLLFGIHGECSVAEFSMYSCCMHYDACRGAAAVACRIMSLPCSAMRRRLLWALKPSAMS